VHRKCLCLAKKRGKSKGKQDMTYSKRQSDMGVHGAVHLIFKEANNRYIQAPLLELTIERHQLCCSEDKNQMQVVKSKTYGSLNGENHDQEQRVHRH